MLLLLSFSAGCTCAARHVDDAGGAGLDAGPLAVDAGAAPTDAGSDAGLPFPDAAVVRTCTEAFDAPIGAPCELPPETQCRVTDLCCVAQARCWEGRVSSLDHPETCEGEVRPTSCAPSPADVRGSTPLGDVTFTSVFASFTFAFAVDVALVFTPDDAFAFCDGDRLALWLLPGVGSGGSTDYVGTHHTLAMLVVGGALETADAVVEIDRYDRGEDAPSGRLAGHVTVDGWGIAAPFEAEGCLEIDRTGP